MSVFSRTYNQYWPAIKFNGYRGCVLMSEQKNAVKLRKTEVEYDVVKDIDEW